MRRNREKDAGVYETPFSEKKNTKSYWQPSERQPKPLKIFFAKIFFDTFRLFASFRSALILPFFLLQHAHLQMSEARESLLPQVPAGGMRAMCCSRTFGSPR
jgi:hypothetical protein